METQDIERKESWDKDQADKYLRTMCAFNNTDGGVIFIGIRDKGEVIGVKDPHDVLKVIPDTIRNKLNFKASVVPVIIDGKTCIKITVEKGNRYVDLDGVFYKRVGNTTQKVTGEELQSWILSNMKRTWIDMPSDMGIDSVSEDAIKHFVDSGKAAGRLPQDLKYDARTILKRFDLIGNDGKLTNAGWLLFGKDSSRAYEGTFIKIGEFSNDGELRREDRIFVPLIMQPDAVMDALYEKYIPGLFEYEGARRFVVYRYPKKAIREALVNAASHKKYEAFEPITVRVDPNELSIYNPGSLPEGWSVNDPNTRKPVRRNKNIAETFHQAGFSESWGKGIDLILKECRENGNPKPEFSSYPSGTTVTFLPNRIIENGIPMKLPIDLSENEIKVCKLIEADNNITTSNISKQLEISNTTAWRILASLTEKGVIVRIGSDKSGSWKFV